MVDRDIAAEEDANARRAAERRADEDSGITEAAERTVDSVLAPFTRERADADDGAARRDENDADQRPT